MEHSQSLRCSSESGCGITVFFLGRQRGKRVGQADERDIECMIKRTHAMKLKKVRKATKDFSWKRRGLSHASNLAKNGSQFRQQLVASGYHTGHTVKPRRLPLTSLFFSGSFMVSFHLPLTYWYSSLAPAVVTLHTFHNAFCDTWHSTSPKASSLSSLVK